MHRFALDLPPLIPRDDLFGNPEKASPNISPDGTRLAYLAPDEGVLNVWTVRPHGKVVTRGPKSTCQHDADDQPARRRTR